MLIKKIRTNGTTRFTRSLMKNFIIFFCELIDNIYSCSFHIPVKINNLEFLLYLLVMRKYSIFIVLLLVLPLNALLAKQLQEDSLRFIQSWELSEDRSFVKLINIDTTLSEFHNYNPVYQNDISSAFLGNIGLAGISHVFRKSYNYPDFILFRGYENYFHDARSSSFYNTKRPYTRIMYSGGGSDDNSGQNIKLIHTQNINKYLNVGIKYDLISSSGHYNRQSVKNNSFSFFLTYRKSKYLLYSAFSTNKFKIEENGGLKDDEDLSGNYSYSTLPVNLDGAKSLLKNTNFSITQEYLLGPEIIREPEDSLSIDSIIYPPYNNSSELKLVHDLYYNTSYRIFDDQNPQSGFFRNIYFDEQYTFDSVKYRNIINTLQLVKENDLLGIKSLGGKVLLGSRFLKTYFYQKDTSFWDNYFSMSLFDRSDTKINWDIFSKYYFSGYKAGDYNIRFNISARLAGLSDNNIAGIKTSIIRKRADYLLSEYSSNNFCWINSFSKEVFSDLELYYTNEYRKFYAGLSYTSVKNFVFFDSLALPDQYEGTVNVVSVNMKKNFKSGKWTFNNELVLQYTENEDVIRIPVLSTYNQISREGSLFKGSLDTRIGLRIHYNTGFYAYSYMPATGQFYLQDEKMLGNYPYLDIFLNLKVKRTRFFLIYEHFNSWFMKNNYFHVLHYPMKSAFFKFGLSWSFYD